MINKAILVGNLGADPETRTTANGTMVANLRIATTTRHKDQDGEWTDRTEWHRVSCFGRTAENVDRFLKKGRQVYIEGRIQTREWTDQNGNKRWSTEIVAREIKFLGGRESYDDAPTPTTNNASSSGGSSAGGYGGENQGGNQGRPDPDIPF